MSKGLTSFLVGTAMAAGGCAGSLTTPQAHRIQVTVDSRRGSDIGPGTVWSTFVGSGGPINCSNRAIVPLNPDMDITGFPQTGLLCTPLGTPGGRTCSANATCSANTADGVGMTLFPSPASASLFTGWTGPACNTAGGGACTIIPTAASPAVINVTATFRQPRITLTTTSGTIGNNEVKVTASCRPTILPLINPITQIMYLRNSGSDSTGVPDNCDSHVTFSANPAPLPNQWGGACANTVGPICQVFVTDDVTVIVNYSL